ncbi:antitoxin [Calidifontibacter terrae]
MDLNSLISKAKDFARKNPDKVRQGVDKAETIVNEKTGGKFADQIHKGGDAVEGQLGVPGQATTNTPAQQPTGDQPQGQQPTTPQN